MKIIEALTKVRDDLRSGTIPQEHFDMNHAWCGTAGCIGGWIGKYVGMDVLADAFTCHDVLDQYKAEGGISDDLQWLFYPPEETLAYTAKPLDAARAIDNFLNAKPSPWEGVMNETK